MSLSVFQSALGHDGAGGARTMWAGLYGPFEADPRPDPANVMEADAYQLFVARSSQMGWLTDPSVPGPPGLWGMNDAGQEISETDEDRPASWFQVVLTGPSIAHPLLPVLPFLACAADVTARLGELDLRAVQVLLPSASAATSSDRNAVRRLVDMAGWFANCPPESRATIGVSLHTSQRRDPAPIISRLGEPAVAPWQSTVRWEALSVEGREPSWMAGTVACELGDGEPLQSLQFDGDLIEWSIGAVAWLATYVGHVAHEAGFSRPLLLTISKRQAVAR